MTRIYGILKRQVGLVLCFPLCALFCAEPDFYVWQRQHTPELKSAAAEFYRKCPGRLYFLAGEIENNGHVIRIDPLKVVDFTRAVPVVRIHVKNLKKTPAALAAFFAEKVIPVMQEIRMYADNMELCTAKEYWPFPSYADLLFGVK